MENLTKTTNLKEEIPELISLKEYLDLAFSGVESIQKELYDTWYTKLYTYFMRRLRNNDSALDCISDTFTKMYNSQAYIEKGTLFDKYIYRVAQTVLLDFIRKHKNTTESFDDEESLLSNEVVSPYSSEDKARHALLRCQIEYCFSELNKRDGEILKLRVLDELEYEEISSLLDMNIDATRKAYSRALKKFETVYKNRYGEYE